MNKKVILLPLLLGCFSLAAQHQQEAVSGHYQTLKSFSANPNPERAWMDTV